MALNNNAANTFPDNFKSALRTGDSKMVMDLFYDQVTDIAIDNPKSLHTAIKAALIPFDEKNFNSSYLVGVIIDNLPTNKKLVDNLATLIAQRSIPMNAGGGVT